MKGLIPAAAAFLAVAFGAGCGSKGGDALVFTGRQASVVIAPGAPDVTRFAAEELTNFLFQATGERVPLVTECPAGCVAIIVGTNAWSAAAGLDPTKLKRDGFILKTDAAGRRVYIAGCDEPNFDMHRKVNREPSDAWGRRAWERASVFGVYDFLERHVGCRFYFPGEMGTIVPSRPVLRIPSGTFVSEPDWRQRIVFTAEFGEWPDPLPTKNARWRVEQLEQLRLRSHTRLVRSCHGQFWANYALRYGKAHPEWFLKTKDGRRLNDPNPKLGQHDSQHLCQTSAIWDEIYKDAKAYLTGRPASERGAVRSVNDPKPGWGDYGMNGDLFDVMPHDGMHKCYCERCQAAYAKAKDPAMWADEIIWEQTAKLARRLKDEGVKGWISQAAYSPYRSVPDVELPDNVVVNICERGPWSVADPAQLATELAEVKAWSEKAHGNVWTWTYVGKFECSNLNLPDVPMGTPRAFAGYYPKVAPYVFGVFPELGSEKFIFHHLDLYLYSRIAWDNKVDTAAVLEEYYRLMYGKGGPFVERVFDEIERIWLHEIAGKTVDTPLGPASIPPSRHELLTKVYSPAKIGELEGLFAQGLAAVPSGSAEAKRIAYMQEKILAPLAARVRRYRVENDPKTELAWRAEHPQPVMTCDFSGPDGWARNSGSITRDTTTCFSAPASVKLAVTDDRGNVPGSYCRAQMSMGAVLQPGRTYRLSCFLKMKDLTPVDKIGGLQLLFTAPVNRHFGDPQGGPSPNGTRDWFPMVYEFTTPKDMPPDTKCPFYFRTILAHGTVWIDDVRIDEIGGGPAPVRGTSGPALTLRAGGTAVVIAPKAPSVVHVAATEMTNFLAQALGGAVPLLTEPAAGRVNVILGTNAWSVAAGLDPTKLKRDGFILKTDAARRRIYVAGCDDPKHDLARMLARDKPDHWSSRAWERGTLNATYDFLERVVGCRFYFPGELGTIVPRKPVIDVPALDIRSEPDWSLRIIFPHGFGVWPPELGAKDRNQQLEQYRLRTQSRNFGGCHGQFWANYAARFAKTHPEYFALRKDGTRYDNPAGNAPQIRGQHLCQSSKVWDELYEDAKSYFRGEDAEVRGATSGFDANRRVAWGSYGHYGEFFDVMPNDGNPKCFCADCQAAYRNASQPVEGPASELIWGQTAKLANRIKADGLKGTILQAAYSDYRTLPQVDIPDNVICCLCEPGPTSTAYPGCARREFDEIDAWSRKMDGRIWLWTYPGKHDCFNLNIADVPCCVPQATVAYLKRVAPKVMGVFPQTACVNFIYCHLDLYLYSRIAWDNACDAGAVLDEYYRLMYGKGATAMRKLFEAFEKDWLGLVGEPQPTSIGYRYAPPAEYQMMTGRYTSDRIAGYESLVKDALSSMPANSLEARRIAFMNDQLLAPLARRARSYPKTIDPREELAWRAAHKGSVSLLKNGDFATLKHLNIDPNGKVELDREVYFSAPTSLKIVSTNDLPESSGFYCRAGALQGVKLKPSTRYRLSGFRKTKDVVPVSAMGGTDFLVSKPIDRSLPGGRMPNGTMDWHRFAYEFTTPAKVEPGLVTQIGPRFVYATGTTWIDDLRLDELPASASVKTGANK